MVQEFIDKLDPEELQSGYFQHDGATAHTDYVIICLNFLKQLYDDLIYPPRLPDLTALEYF